MHRAGNMYAYGCCGMIREGVFADQPAALKFYVPGLAKDPAIAAASLKAELHAYAALEDIQGEYKGSTSCSRQPETAAHLQRAHFPVCRHRDSAPAWNRPLPNQRGPVHICCASVVGAIQDIPDTHPRVHCLHGVELLPLFAHLLM